MQEPQQQHQHHTEHSAVKSHGAIRKFWHRTIEVAAESKRARLMLGAVICCSMLMVLATLIATFYFINTDKIDMATGILLGGIFTFFGGLMSISIPAYLSATKISRSEDKNNG